MAVDLLDSLYFLIGLKLQSGLSQLDVGLPASGVVRPARLSSLERDLLKDALAVVKRFKAIVRHQFHLES
jgi:CBS domain-containing protein